MRDGNTKVQWGRWWIFNVVSLPMRDGNRLTQGCFAHAVELLAYL